MSFMDHRVMIKSGSALKHNMNVRALLMVLVSGKKHERKDIP